ncbi:MAG TPA: helix-turn-helix transcriptional regulator [Microlunatus sp.]|nr:helix-turn-helix transcriptional regulator [Microlunatus sp.]
MDNRREVRDFLASRRAKITPQQAGLPAWGGGRRRVPGLRREEVALLAGVSIDYYTRLERGNLDGASESVLAAIADALQLDEAERTHLDNLARAAQPSPRRTRPRARANSVRPELQRILDAITDVPAYLRNGRRDLLAANPLGRALYAPMYDHPDRPVNVARFVFLDPRAHDYFLDWPTAARDMVSALRVEAGKTPRDRALFDLVGELSTRSDEFATFWASQNVRFHRSGFKGIHHPVVGALHLSFEAMELPADPGLSLVIYSAEPGSSSDDGLRLLASWAATTGHPTLPDTDTTRTRPTTSAEPSSLQKESDT